MKIAFFTGHIAGEPRKATVTLLADSFAQAGHETRIITIGYSLLSILKGDPNHAYARTLRLNRWFEVSAHLAGYLQRKLLGPSRLPSALLNQLTKPFFRWYCSRLPFAVKTELKNAHAIIIETGPGLLLVPALRTLFPDTTLIYMVCDRLATLRVHPVMMDAERKYEPLFDLITAPSALIAADYAHPHCHFIPQGVDTAAFDNAMANPFTTQKNIVAVGDMLFHEEAVYRLAKENPDWTVHLFGGKARCEETLPNIVVHGETPFAKVLPYIKFATIGFAPYRPAPGADYISQSSLKLKQYTYARLPILAPRFAAASYANIIPYDPEDLSTLTPALIHAQTFDRNSISTEGIKSWPEVMQMYVKAIDDTKSHGAA